MAQAIGSAAETANFDAHRYKMSYRRNLLF